MKTMLLAFAVIVVAGFGLWAVLGTWPGNSTASYYAADTGVSLPAAPGEESDK